jgi:peptidoglycan/xylan/chitin deacetylase (PgdA/CDA1 family)
MTTAAGCTIVFYHYVRDVERTPFPGIRGLSVAGFEAQLDWLQSQYEMVDVPAFERAVTTGTPFPRPSALLTFDDGLADHFEHVFPALAKRGLGGIFFVSGAPLRGTPTLLNVHKTHFLLSHLGADRFSDEAGQALEAAGHPAVVPGAASADNDARPGVYRYDEAPEVRIKRVLNYEAPYPVADRVLSALFSRHLGDEGAFAERLYLSSDQVREMARGGMTFGFHTETHRVLSRLDAADQRAELSRGVGLVAGLTGQSTVSFCYPYGFPHTYNAATLDILAAAGYSMAFNTARRDAFAGVDGRYELPRFDTRDIARQAGTTRGSVETTPGNTPQGVGARA